MKRFTLDQKLNLVRLYLTDRYSCRGLAEEFGVDHKSVLKWVALYQQHGEEALKERSCTIYSDEFKLDVLQYLYDTGASILKTAVKFNIPSPQTVQRWKRKMEQGLLGARNPVPKERLHMTKKNQSQTDKSLKKLEEEIEQLRMENAYLKKLNALVQNKQQSPNKRKLK